MRRRAFLASAFSALAYPSVAYAQTRIPRVGYLQPDAPEASGPFYKAFLAGLSDLGYVPGETIEIVARFAYGDEGQLAVLAQSLIDEKVDIIVSGGPGVIAARKTTSTVPIVAAVIGGIVSAGLAESLAHPGGNITGSSYIAEQLNGKRLALLKRAQPALKNVGFVTVPGVSSTARYLRALEAPSAAMGVTVRLIEISSAVDCEAALDAGEGRSIDGLAVWDMPQFTTGDGPRILAQTALKRGIPSVGGLYLGRNGGLLGYGPDFADMFRHSASFVDKILKGAKPGDIPIEQPTRFVTTVDLKSAKTLGLTIPPDILASADEVIE